MESAPPRARDQSRFVGNTAALVVATGVATVLSLIQVKLLSGALTNAEFGRFAALRGLSLLISMIAANGLPAVLVRYLPGQEMRGERSRAALFVILGVLVAGLLSGVLVRTGMGWIPGWSRVGGAGMPGPGFAMLSVAVAIKLVLYGGFNGLRRFGAQTVLEVAGLAAQVVWIFSERDALSIDRLFSILGTVSVMTILLGLPWLVARLVRDIRPGQADTGAVVDARRAYAMYWAGATGLSVVAIAFSDADRLFLSQVIAFELLAFFHVGSRIIRLVDRFMAVPVLALQPEISRLDALGRSADADERARAFIRFSVVAGTLAAAFAAAYAPWIVRGVTSGRYATAGALVSLMAAGVPLAALTAPLTTVMKARDAVARALICDLVWAVVYLGTALVLLPRIGIIGAGIAHVAGRAAQLVSALPGSVLRVRAARGATWALRLAGSAVAAFVVPAILLRTGGDSVVAMVVAIVWIPVGIVGFRSLVRIWGLLNGGDRRILTRMLAARGMHRLASWI